MPPPPSIGNPVHCTPTVTQPLVPKSFHKTKTCLDLKILSRSRPIHGLDRMTGQVLNFETKTNSLANDLSSARSLILFKTGLDFKIVLRPRSIPGLDRILKSRPVLYKINDLT